MTGGSDTMEGCVERVLRSRTFRHAPSSRRLLKYLSDHSLAGDAEQLKEYTIGVDAFGKPANYDPRIDSTVRIQIGRLRQKLSEYYRDEGRDDSLIVDLHKGRFSLTCGPRSESFEPVSDVEHPVARDPWRLAALILGVLLVVVLAGSGYFYWKLRTGQNVRPSVAHSWSPELAELWGPLLNPSRPLIIAVGNPLFLEFENKLLYRDLSIEKPDDLLRSPQLAAVRKALANPESRPVHYYAAVGDVSAAFQLGQRLGPHRANISVVRSSQLQWQQLADANVLFLGPPRFFVDKLNSLPATLEITETGDGFLVAHPQVGEPNFFMFRDPAGFLTEDGEACVLVTHTAGPVGNTEVVTFASNSTFGRAGAVNAFTDAEFATMLVARMRGSSDHIPRYYQVLLKVKYKGGVPTETSYVLHRSLRPRN